MLDNESFNSITEVVNVTANKDPRIRINSLGIHNTNIKMIGVPICPDLLRYEDLGQADSLRGKALRGFLFVLDRVLRLKG
jgi:hypothetical protein